MLSKISQMERGKYFVSLTCGMYKSQTQKRKVKWVLPRDGGLVQGCRQGVGGGVGQMLFKGTNLQQVVNKS